VVDLAIGEEVRLGRLHARVQELGADGEPDPAPAEPAGSAGKEAPRHAEELPVTGRRMRALLATARRVADARIPVILHGETGTGKEVLARFLHAEGPRRARPMACLNCAAIAAQLLESQLFGHERGAFTGAVQQQKGVFEEANGGTVFLDEVAELPAAAQAALLRVIESGRVCRLGSSREVAIDVRILAATHRDLEAMCAAGQFREDLYFRLNGVTLSIPPLRDRLDEIEPLARSFLRHANEANRRAVRGIMPEAMELLRRHAWPGNVRELRQAIEHAVVITEGDEIRPADLPARVQAGRAAGGAARAAGGAARALPGAAAAEATQAAGSAEDFRARMQRHEAEVIEEALGACNGNQTLAARRLVMPLRTLVHKIRTLGLKSQGG